MLQIFKIVDGVVELEQQLKLESYGNIECYFSVGSCIILQAKAFSRWMLLSKISGFSCRQWPFSTNRRYWFLYNNCTRNTSKIQQRKRMKITSWCRIWMRSLRLKVRHQWLGHRLRIHGSFLLMMDGHWMDVRQKTLLCRNSLWVLSLQIMECQITVWSMYFFLFFLFN